MPFSPSPPNKNPKTHRRQKEVHVARFLSLKKSVKAERSASARCIGCRRQCVKKAASSSARACGRGARNYAQV